MRISDWSSDVCSSDLASTRSPYVPHDHRCHPWAPRVPAISSLHGVVPATTTAVTRCRRMDSRNHASASGGRYLPEIGRASCRERVLSVRVDLGGRRIIKKKKANNQLSKTESKE